MEDGEEAPLVASTYGGRPGIAASRGRVPGQLEDMPDPLPYRLPLKHFRDRNSINEVRCTPVHSLNYLL